MYLEPKLFVLMVFDKGTLSVIKILIILNINIRMFFSRNNDWRHCTYWIFITV